MRAHLGTDLREHSGRGAQRGVAEGRKRGGAGCPGQDEERERAHQRDCLLRVLVVSDGVRSERLGLDVLGPPVAGCLAVGLRAVRSGVSVRSNSKQRDSK